jgi:8-amino-7-oxononanoate synthase
MSDVVGAPREQNSLTTTLQARLQQRQQTHLYRTRLVHDSPQTPLLQMDGRQVLSFCSNDYLGLANHPQLKRALQHGVEKYGVGSGASHLVNGHTQAHHDLEQQLAEFMGHERALVFSSGYMANLGIITGLLGRNDAIFLDKLNHASLVDAALLSRAKLYRYAHHDITQLEQMLATAKPVHKLIVTDGVFSMDGDIALLPQLVELANKYHAWLMVDDAHGLGVVGETGRGSAELYHLNTAEIPILMGTLGKAFGVSGAFVAGSALLIETLIQTARSYIYTTALPPALAYATQTSLQLVNTETWRRSRLHDLIKYFRNQAQLKNVPLSDSHTPIQPIMLGDAARAVRVSQQLLQHDILVTAIRPPTVPQGGARLRITLSAAHTEPQIDRLLETLQPILIATD